MTDAPHQFETLLAAMIDQTITPSERDALMQMLRDDAVLRRQYIEHMLLDADMHWDQARVPGVQGVQGVQGSGFRLQEKVPTPTLGRRRSVWYYSALAALIALALTAWFLLSPSPQPPTPSPTSRAPHAVALLSDLSPDAVFAPGSEPVPMRPGSDLPPGPIRLTAGRAQLMFKSTAVIDLTGPCEFEMTGPNRGKLIAGSLGAYVPEKAHGFTVDLPDGSRIVDLGTAFGLEVGEAGRTKLRVTEGKVKWSPGPSAWPDVEPVVILAGQRAWVSPGAAAPRLFDEVVPEDFHQDPNLADNWTQFRFHGPDAVSINWDQAGEALHLRKSGSASSVAGLHRTGETRSATDSVTLTIKDLVISGGSWCQIGLVISSVAKPQLLDANKKYELELRSNDQGKTWFYLVRKDTGSGEGYDLFVSDPFVFSGPIVLEIARHGDNYDFMANGITIYTASTYSRAAHDSMVHYAITFGGNGNLAATVDDFGVNVVAASRPPSPIGIRRD